MTPRRHAAFTARAKALAVLPCMVNVHRAGDRGEFPGIGARPGKPNAPVLSPEGSSLATASGRAMPGHILLLTATCEVPD